MDKLIAGARCALSYLFYWAGDLVSRTPDTHLYWVERGLYAVYSFCMSASIILQVNGKGPWSILEIEVDDLI